MSVFTPDSECRMRDSTFGIDGDSERRLLGAAVDDRRDPAGDAQATGLVLAPGSRVTASRVAGP